MAADGPLGQVGNAVHYLVRDPVEETFDDFIALGRALRENGRFPVSRPSLQVAGLRLLQWHSSPHALISAEVVPFRPHRGILLIVEEPTDGRPNRMAAMAARRTLSGAARHTRHRRRLDVRFDRRMESRHRGWRTDPQYITVVYLDDDPLATTAALAPLVEERWRSGAVRPVFAGPMRTMIRWEAWP